MAMVSPANTYVCITQTAPACADDEPDKYYPTGTRNYARVVANDAYQGAAVAEFMQANGVTKLYLLNDEQAYGLGVASNTRDAAEFLGIEVVGFEAWDAKASNYEALMNQVKESGADALFLGGLTDENGAQLIKDKVKVLGPNDGDVALYMPDGFYQQSSIDEAGVENTRNAYFSVAGLPVDEFSSEAAQEFITTFEATLGGEPVDPYSIYGAQAAQVLLDAIAASDGTRASVIDADVRDGLPGAASSVTSHSVPRATRSRAATSSTSASAWARRRSNHWRPSRRRRRRSTLHLVFD